MVVLTTTEMDGPGAGSSAGGPPAGAVVVPVETAAPAAAAAAAASPAGAAAAGAWSVWTMVSSTRVSVTWAGGAAARPAWTRLHARLAWAAALFLLGCAAAGLAFFAMLLPTANSRLLGKACTPPTDAEVAALRATSEYLLLAASAQVLAATMGLLVPAWPVAVFSWLVGSVTGYRAASLLWMLVACHDSAHGELAFHFWLFYAVLLAVFSVGAVVSLP